MATEIIKFFEGFRTADELAKACQDVKTKGFPKMPDMSPLKDLAMQMVDDVIDFSVSLSAREILWEESPTIYHTAVIPQVVEDFTRRYDRGEWPELCIF